MLLPPSLSKSPVFALFCSSCLLLLMLLLPGPASAERVEDLYEVVLPVADESSELRNAAMADGLAEMLVRQSGDGQILQKLTPPSAAAYVKQYRYESRPSQTSNEPDSKQIRLQYNGTRIMDFLRSNGLPIWGEHRAVAVLWLAVRDGRNQYLLKAGDSSLFKAQLEKLFKQRGIPVVWPAYDEQDRAVIKFADVWAGFSGPLTQASARYSQGPVLAGNLSWSGGIWSADWTVLDQRFSQRWHLRSSDYEQLLADAVNQMSDAMGKQYAVLESNDGSADAEVALDIENITSLNSFIRVKKYLASLQAVQDVQVTRLGGNGVEFRLALRSRVDDLLKLLSTSAQLRAVEKPVAVSPPVAAVSGTAGGAGAAPAVAEAEPLTALAAKRYYYRLVN